MILKNIFGTIEKNHFWPTLQWMVCMTLNCVSLTQSSVGQANPNKNELAHVARHTSVKNLVRKYTVWGSDFSEDHQIKF